MKQKITNTEKARVFEEMQRCHAAQLAFWKKEGCPGDFYQWLLEKVEREIMKAKS